MSADPHARTLAPELAAHNSFESPTEEIRIVKPRAWLALVACVVLAVCVVAWSMIVQIPISASTSGAVLPNGSLIPVNSPASGRVVQLLASPKQDIKKGTPIANVRTDDGKLVQVTAPVTGSVSSLFATVGTLVEKESVVANLVYYDGPLVLRMFPDPVTAQQLTKGSRVIVEAIGEGGVRGTFDTEVLEIGEPITANQVSNLVGDDALTGLLVGERKIVTPVLAALDPQQIYDELIAQGFPADDESGGSSFLVKATFIIGSKHPIEYVFGSAS